MYNITKHANISIMMNLSVKMSMSSIKEAWSSVAEKKLFVIDKFVVGEVLAGHLVKSYKVMGGLFSPIIRLMLLLTGKVSSAIL